MSQFAPESTVLSYSERVELGRALRAQTPRAAHGEWQTPAGRRDPIDNLEESSQGRMPDLVPIRYGRMLTDPFAFLRGSAAVMAHDLASTPVSGIRVQACGDCHIANFGLFATPERNLVFDINDFDETLPAPWEWDVKRLAASFSVVMRTRGFSNTACSDAVLSLARSYQQHLSEYGKMRVLDVWYSRLDDKMLIDAAPTAEARKKRKQMSSKARASVAEYLFPKITGVTDGHRRLVDQPPLMFHLPDHQELEERLLAMLAGYHDTLPDHLIKLFEHFRYEDFAFKVVGVGSVGTRCFVMLFLAGVDDPLLLQAKEARRSVLEPFAGASEFSHHGRRIVVGQRLMQSASDMFLGWTTSPADGGHYYIRQLRDMKYSPPLDKLSEKSLIRYAAICGWVLARAHTKGGDAAMISGYLGKGDAFGKALAQFALAYGEQTVRDHASLAQAVDSRRLQAVLGR
jgi:uncharacterized protein (DUF2252 family)